MAASSPALALRTASDSGWDADSPLEIQRDWVAHHRLFQAEARLIHVLQRVIGPPANHARLLRGLKLFTSPNYIQYQVLLFFLFVDFRFAFRIYVGLEMSRAVNRVAKWMYRVPRPFKTFSFLRNDSKKNKGASFSFPSMSVQNITLIYQSLWLQFGAAIDGTVRIPGFAGLVFVAILSAVSVTRMYRGLHYLHDIAMSYLIGTALMIILQAMASHEATVLVSFCVFYATAWALSSLIAERTLAPSWFGQGTRGGGWGGWGGWGGQDGLDGGWDDWGSGGEWRRGWWLCS
jgi:membrane-associated phospholipid phosphatase